jgi:hypothetical protein
MTTHDHQTNATEPLPGAPGAEQGQQYDPQGREFDRGASGFDTPGTQDFRDSDAAFPSERTTTAHESGTATQPAADERLAAASPSGSDTDLSLFGENDLSGFRTRWSDVQAAFVDDPRAAVHNADALVSEVVEQLTTGFSEVRARMEGQWARGEETSTEDLRVALTRYREFFQRLLAV